MELKQVGAGIVAGLVVGGLGVGFYVDNSADKTIDSLNQQIDGLNEDVATLANQPAEVIEVDNGNLDLVLNHIFDNDGSVEYLTEDLDDNQIDQIVERVSFINELKVIVANEVKDEFKDEVDGLVVSTSGGDVTLDDSEIKRLHVDDDDDELTVTVDDWDDLEGSVHVTGTFRQDTVEFKFELDALFEDGEFDRFDNVVVTEA